MKSLFHLSLPCKSVDATKKFYVNKLGAKLGRHATTWVDIDLYENQITFAKSGVFNFNYQNYRFGESIIPAFHFGVILEEKDWNAIYNNLSSKHVDLTEKQTFSPESVGTHQSFFLVDPNGYHLEFKTFSKSDDVFKV